MAEKLSPRRQHWCRLLQGVVLEFAKDGFRGVPDEVHGALRTLMEYAARDIERHEAEEEKRRQKWEGIPIDLLPGVLGIPPSRGRSLGGASDVSHCGVNGP